jgi:glycosyltransferase involved in cell wall biosynthesis
VISERPFADGRRTALFVFSELRAGGGRLTADWLWRLAAFDAAGWATHAVLVNKDPDLEATVDALVAKGRFPVTTGLHHFAQRDRRVRPSWYGPLPEGQEFADRVADWLDWLTAQVPGALVVADSPVTYPYVARMTNPTVARLAALHRNHLGAATEGHPLDPAAAPLAATFAERGFDEAQAAFDMLVVMTATQAEDLRARYGEQTPATVIPPPVGGPAAGIGHASLQPAWPGRRIVSVGPLEPGSRHGDAIRAFALVAAAHPDTVLELVGHGELGAELTAMAFESGVGNRVRLVAPGTDPDEPFAQAALALWTGRRDACPPAMARALRAGVPVLAYDVRYGPRELLGEVPAEARAAAGDLIADGDIGALARAMSRRLQSRGTPTRAADPPPLGSDRLPATDPDAVARRWVRLAAQVAEAACDHRTPTLLVETITTNARIIRVPGVLADAGSALSAWTFELPGVVEPVGWLGEPQIPSAAQAAEDDEDDEPPTHPHAAGPTRSVFVQLRSSSLAFAAVESDAEVRVEFTDGTTTVPVLAPAFEERIVASRVGNATMRRRPDGTIWVAPRPELLLATQLDGRLLVRTAPQAPPSDVTHAVDWVVDIDWADLVTEERGVSFTGRLRATWIAPADDSPPAICVPDVGGFSRTVGQLHYTSDAAVDGPTWSADVAGLIETDPLVATTALARRALPLHVGFRGLLLPIGGLWTHGQRARIHLAGPRGEVTLLPSPGGRVIAAPGRGYRARASGAVRSLVQRG